MPDCQKYRDYRVVFFSLGPFEFFSTTCTEHDTSQNTATVLKYASDRRGGGGRGKETAAYEMSD